MIRIEAAHTVRSVYEWQLLHSRCGTECLFMLHMTLNILGKDPGDNRESVPLLLGLRKNLLSGLVSFFWREAQAQTPTGSALVLAGVVGAGNIHLGVFPEYFIFLELQEPLRAAACTLTCFKEEQKNPDWWQNLYCNRVFKSDDVIKIYMTGRESMFILLEL